MRPGRRSRTAEATAAMRALHQLVDADPKVLEDPFAALLLASGPAPAIGSLPMMRTLLARRLRRRIPPWLPRRPATGARRIRAQVVVRSRYAEDRLEAALERGIGQYVVLAAGLDSFALRRSDLAARLQVFEVDHPDSLEWKRDRLAALDAPAPACLTLVPVDLEHQSLAEGLEATPYDPAAPAFFSWLGVTYYLSDDAIRDTLRFVAEQAAGGELVFDYWSRTGLGDPADRLLLDAIRVSVAGQGERMSSFLEPAGVRARLEEAGLELLEDLGPRATQSRYLAGRTDGLRVPGFAHLAHARVPKRP